MEGFPFNDREVEPIVSDSLIQTNVSLSDFTSWKVGGLAEYYCAPQNFDELKTVMLEARSKLLPVTILGGGTNVLVSDDGVSGLVIHTHLLNSVEVLEEGENLVIEAFGGTPKSEVLKLFMKYRLEPAIFLAGLPGDMAGGIVMNAGVGHKVLPREFCEIVQSFDVFTYSHNADIEERTFEHKDVVWSYRKSKNWQPGVITKVRVSWPNNPNDDVLKAVREGNRRRKDTQPLSEPSCGSVFKNPEGDHSGRLIEVSGLKGFQIGGAQVSEKHGNFIVNKGHSTAMDIHKVISHVQKTVEEKHKIRLTNEVVYLGEWPK